MDDIQNKATYRTPVHPDKFYAYNRYTKSFVEVTPEPLSILSLEGFEIFVNPSIANEGCWNVTEGITGRSISGFDWFDKAALIEYAKRQLARAGADGLRQSIEKAIEETGISPRYQQ